MSVTDAKAIRKTERDKIYDVCSEVDTLVKSDVYDDEVATNISTRVSTAEASLVEFNKQMDILLEHSKEDPDKFSNYTTEREKVNQVVQEMVQTRITWGENYDRARQAAGSGMQSRHGQQEKDEDSDEVVGEMINEIARSMYRQFGVSDVGRIRELATKDGKLRSKKDVTRNVLSMRGDLRPYTTSTPYASMSERRSDRRVSFLPGDLEETLPYRRSTATEESTRKKKKKKKKKYVVVSSSESSDSSDSSSSSSEESSDSEDMYSLSDTLHGLRRGYEKRSRSKKKKRKKQKNSAEKYIQRTQLPTFDGTGDFDSWWSMFLSIVDESSEPKKIKFLKLKQAVTDEPLELIKNLPHCSDSYKRAKRRIYDNYGGVLRQVTRRYTEVQDFKKITENDFRSFRRLLALVDQTIGCLDNAGRISEIGPSALSHSLVGKMPVNVVVKYSEWRGECKRSDDLYALSDFLEQYISRGVTAYETVYGVRSKAAGHKKRVNMNHAQSMHGQQKKEEDLIQRKFKKKCHACKIGVHALWQCDQFKRMSAEDRYKVCASSRLCYRCFSDQHYSPDCPHDRLCGTNGCKGKHHRMLHSEDYSRNRRNEKKEDNSSRGETSDVKTLAAPIPSEEKTEEETSEQPTPASGQTYITQKQYKDREIAMKVIPIRILGKTGMEIVVNALLDEASTTSYVNVNVAAYLDLTGETLASEVEVFGGQKMMVETELVEITIQSMDMSYQYTEMAEVTKRPVGTMTTVDWTILQNQWPHLRDIPFLSPRKKQIDCLLGLNFMDAMKSECKDVEGAIGAPIARKTPLGWCCSGIVKPSNAYKSGSKKTYFTQTLSRNEEDEKLTSLVEKFWKWDDLPEEGMMSAEDKSAEKQLDESIVWKDGRYEAGIPWKDGVPPYVSNNYEQAKKRLDQTERRLISQSRELYEEYIQIFRTYIEKGYLEEVIDGIEIDDAGRVWYLAHFAVIRVDKETSKVRPVYDASAKYEGSSINDYELTGPALQQNLLLVLLRFRLWAIVLGTDISEMYLQILLKEADRDYQRLLIRLDGKDPPRKFRGTRVMFGRKSSPFIALKVSQENARRNKEKYPDAAETVLLSTYMDDSMDSKGSVDKAIELYHQLNGLWNIAGMQPKKWFSNSEKVMEMIPEENRAKKMDLLTQLIPKGKALGSLWSVNDDQLIFEVDDETGEKVICTKRGILKKVAMIFDPLGIITPFTVRARTYIQEMWVRGIEWDEVLPEDIQQKVNNWVGELDDLKKIAVDRCLIRDEKYEKIFIHVFSDASTCVYGAVAYIVTTYAQKEPEVNFVISKGKVAPVKYISVPRLEMQGACISAKISVLLQQLLSNERVEYVFWTDSLDVLIWLTSFCRAYKTYIANRIGYVQERTKPKEWRYVPSELNPADVLTRGLTADDLGKNDLWKNGPAFIRKDRAEWPEIPAQVKTTEPLERKEGAHCMLFFTAKSSYNFEFLRTLAVRFSSWKRTLRFITYVVHFMHEVSKKHTPMLEEKHEVELSLFRLVQQDTWTLEEAKQIYPMLNLFHDEDQVIRNKSRLQKADVLSWDFRNPILLPANHELVKKLVRSIHEENHVNFSYTWHEVKKRFVVPAGRELCKRIVQTCVTCQMINARGMEQMMADLPKTRITTGVRAFHECSVDFAGPFIVKIGRGKVQAKRWICLINCLAVRAVHLEPVWGLDTDKLMLALERFTNRRGRPKTMLSDNGTNFVKGAEVLRSELRNVDWEKVEDKMQNWNIEWRFQPALSPHHGGVHESLVKMTKTALNKIAGNASLTDEEFLTLLCRVEGCLNRRPLCYVDSSPDSRVLTPADFLVGSAEVELMPPKATEDKADSYRERWRLVGVLIRHFWNRWIAEWLTTLRSRQKWLKMRENIKKGDVVMVLEQGVTLPGRWPLAVVVEVYPGNDGLTRSVKIRRMKREYTHSITRICPLKIMI